MRSAARLLFPGTVVCLALLCVSSGCSVMMATRQPDRKNLNVLRRGYTRSQVIAELGPPIWTEEKDGAKRDIYAFRQGYSREEKAMRAGLHAAGDFLTLGLWEIVGTPVETIASGTDMKVEVQYDADGHVVSVQHLDIR